MHSRAHKPLGEKACRPQIGSGLRTRLRCRLARTAAALASSRRGRSAIVRTDGRLATSISTHATRSASAGGCRKSGWLTAASRRLPDRRVQNVWSVTVYVRSVLITSTVDPSKRYTRSYLSRWRAGTELCADKQEEPSGKKGSMGSEKRQKSFRGNLKSVVTLLFPPRFDRAASKTRRYLPERLNVPQSGSMRGAERLRVLDESCELRGQNLGGTDRIRVDFRNLREHLCRF